MAAAVALYLLPGTSALAGEVQVPDGCDVFLTVQMKGCGVSHYWRCAAAPEGSVWEVHYDAEGPFSLSVYDSEFQWLDSQYFDDGTREQLIDPGPDPASLSELLETGEDRYAFVIRETRDGSTRDIVHQGIDTLTGRTVTIDGVDLLETAFASTAMDAVSGEEVYAIEGNQYVLEDERLFFPGPDRFRRDGEERENDFSPMAFMRPGEPGFGETTPHFDCNAAEEIGFDPAPHATQLREKRNDDL